MPLADVLMLRNGLGEMAERKEYYSFAAKQDEQMMPNAHAHVAKGSKLEKSFNPGEWIDEGHAALQDAKSYQAFMAGGRGLTGTRINVKNKGGRML